MKRTSVLFLRFSFFTARSYALLLALAVFLLQCDPVTKYYRVTLDGNGDGSTPRSSFVMIKERSKLVLEPKHQPTRSGFQFDGWYTEATTQNKYDFSAPVVRAITLYAKWQSRAQQYTVTFDPNGGAESSVGVTVNQGDVVPVASAPTFTRVGFQPSGWGSQASGGTPFVPGTTVVNANTTVFAQWTAATTYRVTFDPNGGVGTRTDVTVNQGDVVPANSAPAFTRVGFQPSGWGSQASGGTPFVLGTTVVNANTTVFAQWTAITHQVVFNPNGGVGSEARVTVNDGAMVDANSVPTFTRAGNRPIGWSTNPAGSTSNFIPGTTVVNADVTVYAVWEAGWTVTFVNTGGIAVSQQFVTPGQPVPQPPVASMKRSGQLFLGWYTSVGVLYNFSTPVTADLTLTSRWFDNSSGTFVTSNGAVKVSSGSLISGDFVYPPYDEDGNPITEIQAPDTNLGGSVNSIIIPEGVTKIGKGAFYQLYVGAGTIKLPSTLTEISEGAFEFSKINSIVIPPSVTKIGMRAFAAISELTSVTFENPSSSALTEVETRAFAVTPKLTEVTFPPSLQRIGNQVIIGAAVVTFLGTTPPTVVPEGITWSILVSPNLVSANGQRVNAILVPASAESAYKSATGWSSYSNAIVGY